MGRTKGSKNGVSTKIKKICDMCGKSCMKGHEYVSMELSAYWGYASRHDLEIWSADICEDCVEQKLEPLINFQKEDAILVG